jgi:hypothetical protein
MAWWRRSLTVALLLAAGLVAVHARADDEVTGYELLAPDSHRFAITYDVTTSVEGARAFFNPIREGSQASDERVIERATGKPLRFSVVKGREAKATGLVEAETKDEALFIKVELPGPVPKGGETRIRIFKTYTDPKSYFADGDRIVFDRGLGVRRNLVSLPVGYEIVESTVPAIVSTEPDGRVKLSFFNDRDDTLPVRIVGRRTGATAPTGGSR